MISILELHMIFVRGSYVNFYLICMLKYSVLPFGGKMVLFIVFIKILKSIASAQNWSVTLCLKGTKANGITARDPINNKNEAMVVVYVTISFCLSIHKFVMEKLVFITSIITRSLQKSG